MPESPLISVIVPVYNVEKYLRKCLDSICGQTYRNLEILCVNDGSTDGSAAILEEYATNDARIKIIHQKNSGVSAARNAALKIATGDWITGVDSDDYLALDTYEYALAERNDETDVICFGVQVIWQDLEIDEGFVEYFNLKHEGIIKPTSYHIKTTDSIFVNKLWSRSLIERFNHRFPEGLRFEDTYFYFTLTPFARNISYRPEKKYHYIRWGGSFVSQVSSYTAEISLYRMKTAHKMLEFFHKNPLPQNVQQVDLIAFEDFFYAGMTTIPKQHRPLFREKARQIVHESGLLQRYPRKLRLLSITPWWLKPFVKHKQSKSYYGIPGISFLTISRRDDREIIRFLGIRLFERKLL